MADGETPPQPSRLSRALDHLFEEAETSDEKLDAAIEVVVNSALTQGLVVDEARLNATLVSLRKTRRFVAMERLASELGKVGYRSASLFRFHAQALIERGEYLPALGLLEQARKVAADQGDAETEADTWGLEGRIFKDLYLDAQTRNSKGMPRPPQAVREHYIRRSVAAYHWVWARMPDSQKSHYHGVNAMAVMARGQRDGFSFPNTMSQLEIARKIRNNVQRRFDAFKDKEKAPKSFGDWDYANAAEACAALGQWDEALVWINRYLRVVFRNAFALNGTLRQFEDVWELKASDDGPKGQIVNGLRMALIAADDGGADLTQADTELLRSRIMPTAKAFRNIAPDNPVEDDSGKNERVFGMQGPFSLERLQDIMERARVVARVMTQDARQGAITAGTGFLLPASAVDPSLTGKTYFVTNAHVVSDNPERDGTILRPGDAFARFDAAEELKDMRLDRLLWCSSQHEHDMAVFEVNCRRPEIANIIQVGRGLPHLKIREQRGDRQVLVPGKVYVIGHPLGQALSLSLHDNDLISHENVVGRAPGPEPRRIHYRAPTERGSSGSPVFNSRTLELIGVHHRGGLLNKLNGQPGKHKANEGLWIRPALNEMRAHMGFRGDVFEATGR